MKVGDLVQFSVYGRQRHYNSDLVMDAVGILLAIKNNSAYPYVVMWNPKQIKRGHIRRELRYARKTND